MYDVFAKFANGQPMDIPFEIKVSDIDGDTYVVFDDEMDAEDFLDGMDIDATITCFDGFYNAILCREVMEALSGE